MPCRQSSSKSAMLLAVVIALFSSADGFTSSPPATLHKQLQGPPASMTRSRLYIDHNVETDVRIPVARPKKMRVTSSSKKATAAASSTQTKKTKSKDSHKRRKVPKRASVSVNSKENLKRKQRQEGRNEPLPTDKTSSELVSALCLDLSNPQEEDCADPSPSSSNTKKTTKTAYTAGKTSIQVGDQVVGTVVSLVPYGAFVKLPNYPRHALLHISRMSLYKVNDMKEFAQVGQTIEARVIRADKKNLALTLLSPENDEFINRRNRQKERMALWKKVVNGDADDDTKKKLLDMDYLVRKEMEEMWEMETSPRAMEV